MKLITYTANGEQSVGAVIGDGHVTNKVILTSAEVGAV